MSKTTDDLEAVRVVATTLEGFSADEQERIIRWAREKLGLAATPRNLPESRSAQLPAPIAQRPADTGEAQQSVASGKDLKTFVNDKNPKSDIQFAATVAYFYRFEAPSGQRKNEIDAGTLQDACRLAGRRRLRKPDQTLRNAKNQGVLDSGSEAARFTINTVGENLVAMTLPTQSGSAPKGHKPKKAAKKTPRKKK